MSSELVELPESLLRLDDLLEELGEDAFSLTELDGFLCGIIVGPDDVALDEWWPFDWLANERGVPLSQAAELEALIFARKAEIETELAEGQYAPLFYIDEASEAVVWEAWIGGMQQAMHLRFDFWDALLRDTEDDIRGQAAMGLASALMLADPDTGPDETAGEDEWAAYDDMLETMPEVVAQTAVLLYRLNRPN